MMILAFTVPGPPLAKERLLDARAEGYRSERIGEYELAIARTAQCALSCLPAWSPAGPHALVVRVFRAERRGHLDDFVRCCSDALIREGIIEDERSVVRIQATLGNDKARPRLEVEVQWLGLGASPSSVKEVDGKERDHALG